MRRLSPVYQAVWRASRSWSRWCPAYGSWRGSSSAGVIRCGNRSPPGPAAQPPGPSCPWRCPMAATIPSAALVLVQPAFTESQRLALAGYLAGYRGLTREGLHPGPAPVHRIVPRPVPAPGLGPPPASRPALANWKLTAALAPSAGRVRARTRRLRRAASRSLPHRRGVRRQAIFLRCPEPGTWRPRAGRWPRERLR